MVGRQQVTLAEGVAEMNETLVGDGFHPVQRMASSRVIEDDFEIGQTALLQVSFRITGDGYTSNYLNMGKMAQWIDKVRVYDQIPEYLEDQVHAESAQTHGTECFINKNSTLEEIALRDTSGSNREQTVSHYAETVPQEDVMVRILSRHKCL